MSIDYGGLKKQGMDIIQELIDLDHERNKEVNKLTRKV